MIVMYRVMSPVPMPANTPAFVSSRRVGKQTPRIAGINCYAPAPESATTVTRNWNVVTDRM